MKTKTLLLNLFFITMLSACGAAGHKFQPASLSNPEYSMLYIYRPSHFVGAGSWPEIILDGEHLGSLKNGGYLVKEITPGKHKLTSKGNAWNYALPEIDIVFEAKPREFKYVRYILGASVSGAVGTMVYMNANNTFHFVNSEHARKEIKQLKLSE